MKKVKFDIGYGIEVPSLHCEKCGYNVTDEKELEKAMTALKEQMSKKVKIVRVGTGYGMRFPNEMVKKYRFDKKRAVTVKPELDGLKITAE